MIRVSVLATIVAAAMLAAASLAQTVSQIRVATLGLESWIGRSPLEQISGEDFFARVQSASGPQLSARVLDDLRRLQPGCIYKPVVRDTARHRGTEPSRVVFATRAECDDKLSAAVFASAKIYNGSPDRGWSMGGLSVCLSRPNAELVTVCRSASDGPDCRLAPAPRNFSCGGDTLPVLLHTEEALERTARQECNWKYTEYFAGLELDAQTGGSRWKTNSSLDRRCTDPDAFRSPAVSDFELGTLAYSPVPTDTMKSNSSPVPTSPISSSAASVQPVCPRLGKDIANDPALSELRLAFVCSCAGPVANDFIVWGGEAGIYDLKNKICQSALHAGIVAQSGGNVLVSPITYSGTIFGFEGQGIESRDAFLSGDAMRLSAPTANDLAGSPLTATVPSPPRLTPLGKPAVYGPDGTLVCPLTSPQAPTLCDCPSGPVRGTLYGDTDGYMSDSNPCLAARHAGVLGPDAAGRIKINGAERSSDYRAVSRNGITSRRYGLSYASSFTVEYGGQAPQVLASAGHCPRDMLAMRGSTAPLVCDCNESSWHRVAWGTADGLYADSSSACTAAKHAGIIQPKGGRIKVTPAPGKEKYVGSWGSGVYAYDLGPWPGSFRVESAVLEAGVVPAQPIAPNSPASVPALPAAEPVVAAPTPNPAENTRPVQLPYCPSNLLTYQAKPAPLLCRCTSDSTGGSIWGGERGIYTDDSSICTAAVQAGVINRDGGPVVVTPAPGQESYGGITQNGVGSTGYGSWTGSFTVRRP